MLGDYLKFNGTVFPKPLTPTMSSKTIENVAQSEAGTDLVVVVRAAKRSWSFSFQLTSRTKDILKGLCQQEYVTMYYQGTNYTVRVRDYQERMVDGSEYLSNTDGLFTCSVKVTEF